MDNNTWGIIVLLYLFISPFVAIAFGVIAKVFLFYVGFSTAKEVFPRKEE